MGRSGEDEITARDERSGDENAPTGLDQPVSEVEIEELLYNDQLGLNSRLDQLRRYREALRSDMSVDFGGGDTAGLLAQVEQAISQLEADAEGMGGETDFDDDPLAHRETLSPDDDDLLDLEAVEDADEQRDLVSLDGEDEEAQAASHDDQNR